MSSIYSGKLALAPMVRSGELPTRLMALKYGADLVWGPEIVDRKLVKCERVVNDKLGTIDFLETGGNYKIPGASNLVFRTFPKKESGKLIFQLGTASPEYAIKAGQVIGKDVDGIDVNSGCPKPFSTHSGMGAALLSTPDILESILVGLVNQVGKIFNIPISVKIRLLDRDDPKPTVELVDRLCKTGITNLTLHCRTREMRNRDAPIRSFLPQIIDVCRSHNVSFIINGGILNKKECEEFQEIYGKDVGCMIAEGAECNPTCFSDDPLAWKHVISEFVDIADSVDNYPGNTKYIVLNQLPGKAKIYQKLAKSKSHKEMKEIIGTLAENEGNMIVTKVLQKLELITPPGTPFASHSNGKKRRSEETEQEGVSKRKRVETKEEKKEENKENRKEEPPKTDI